MQQDITAAFTNSGVNNVSFFPQGFFVSVFYCFLNGEVSHWRFAQFIIYEFNETVNLLLDIES